MKRGAISKKLGIATEGPLTKKVCMEKVRKLKDGLKKNRYKGTLREYAVYYRGWYSWKAKNLKSAS